MSFARLRALIVVGVLVLCAAVLVIITLVKDRQSDTAVTQSCAAGDVPANVAWPDDETKVKLNVFNATDSSGLAGQVANDFRSRRFTVLKEDNDPAAKEVKGVAQIRHGPNTVGAAWLVRAYFLNDADLVFDINRKDDIVDVVIGQGYRQLATTTEKNQAIGQVGDPKLPPGTCAAE